MVLSTQAALIDATRVYVYQDDLLAINSSIEQVSLYNIRQVTLGLVVGVPPASAMAINLDKIHSLAEETEPKMFQQGGRYHHWSCLPLLCSKLASIMVPG